MKVAIVVLAGTETHEGLGRIVNALLAAKELKENGDEVKLLFDGAGTEGLATAAKPGHKAHPLYQAVRETIDGACSYCAGAFGVKDALQELGIPLLEDYAQHPSLRSYLAEGYQLLTF